MPMDPHLAAVNKGMAIRQLIHSCFLICQSIITHISIPKVVVPLGSRWMTSSIAKCHHYKTKLCQSIGTIHSSSKGLIDRLGLWARVYVLHQWIATRRIKVKRFVHHPIQVGDAIVCLEGKWLWKFVSCRH